MTAPSISTPALASAAHSPAAARPARKRLYTFLFWTSLLVLTALGAFLRYWRLGYQAYWTDDGYTLYRIRGTFAYLLTQIADQGFPPGWYTLLRLWRILLESRLPAGETYQPYLLRMLPAFFGTLTVPAMCFLGRQFTDRKGALLVALLAAVNPFLIYYSRDIKMYSTFYFFVALNMALFFHWLNSPRNVLWFPLFLLSGVLLTSMHSDAWALPVLQIIFLLFHRRTRPWDIPLWSIATAAAAIIPLYWFFIYNNPQRWEIRLTSEANRGLGWITQYTDMSWTTLASLPTAHILGYLWPVYPPDQRLNDWFLLGGNDFNQHLATRSWSWMAQDQLYAAYTLFTIMLVGLIPWRKIIQFLKTRIFKKPPAPAPITPRPIGTWWLVALWIALPVLALLLTWIPPESPWYQTVWHDHPFKPLWEPRYLGMIIPAWLLWVAACLRRLPFLPLRTLAILAAVGACTWSSLSNHLTYRNAPLNRPAEIVEQYIDQKNRSATAVIIPDVKFVEPAVNVATTIARHVVPLSVEDEAYMPYGTARSISMFPPNLETEADFVRALRNAASNSRFRTLVFTDRFGDLTKPTDSLSDESVFKILGPQWKLVHSETYEWHYEWRFYIFHTWRTRVYQRTP